MNQKTTIGLIVTLGVAILALWWAQASSSSSGVKQVAGPKAIFDPPIEDLKEIEITPAQGAVAIKFVKDGEKWKIAAPIEGPAESAAVMADATKIKDLKYSRAFSKNDAERPTDSMTSLNNPQRIVKLTDKTGKSTVVKVGLRQALSSGTYVQKDGDDTIYLADADLNAEMQKGLDEFRGKRVTEFAQNDATRIEVSGEQQYTLSKNNDQWTVDSPIKGRADKVAVNKILSAASNMTAMKYVDDNPKNLRPYGLEPPRLTVTIQTETKTPKPAPGPPTSAPSEADFEIKKNTYKIAIGGTADDKVFARLLDAGSNSVFQLAATSTKDLGPAMDDLRDKAVVDLQNRQPQSITYSAHGQRIKLVKSASQQWEIAPEIASLPPRPAEMAAVTDLMTALRGMKAMGFEAGQTPSQGLDQPRSTIELVMEGHVEPIKLSVGWLTPSKTGAYIKNERDGTIAIIAAKTADELSVGTMSFLGRELLQFARERASSLEIQKPGTGVKLAKQGGAWKMTSPIQAVPEDASVNNVLGDLAALRGRRVVGSAPEASKFGLDKPTITAIVSVDAPAPPATSQPTPPPAIPPARYSVMLSRRDNLTYAMVGGGDKICEVDAKVYDDLDAEMLKTTIAQFEPSQVSRLSMSGDANFVFEKNGENWRLSGEESFAVDPAKVTEFLTALHDMHARKFVQYSGADLKKSGLDRPERTIGWTGGDGEATTLKIASKGPSPGEAFATISTAPDRVFALKVEDVLKLRKKVQDFQKQGS
jgi:hypothetical protein